MKQDNTHNGIYNKVYNKVYNELYNKVYNEPYNKINKAIICVIYYLATQESLNYVNYI